MKCDRCGQVKENTDKETIIQRNTQTGDLVCIDCAFDEWLREKTVK